MAAATACAGEADATPAKTPHPTNKKEALEVACRERDVATLVDLANSGGGLLSDDIRATACWYSFLLSE